MECLPPTEAAEHFLFRESEFGREFRWVGMQLAELTARASPHTNAIEFAHHLSDGVWERHEQLGAQNAERSDTERLRMALPARQRGWQRGNVSS